MEYHVKAMCGSGCQSRLKIREGGSLVVRVYGTSDDLVEIEGSRYPSDEIGCFDSNVRIFFRDGTVILVGYPKKNAAIWWIDVEKKGIAEQTLTACDDEDADIYSDVFEIDSEILRHEVVDQYSDDKEEDTWQRPAEKPTEEQECICELYALACRLAGQLDASLGALSPRELVDATMVEYAEVIKRAQRVVGAADKEVCK